MNWERISAVPGGGIIELCRGAAAEIPLQSTNLRAAKWRCVDYGQD